MVGRQPVRAQRHHGPAARSGRRLPPPHHARQDKITALTTVWDGSLLDASAIASLIDLALEP